MMKTKSNSERLKNLKGFTLLEVVIALGIMGTVMILLSSSWTGNFRRVKKAKVQTQAVYLLQQKMTELEVFYEGKIGELPKDKQKGTFKNKDFKKFSWEWEANEFKLPDIARLFLQSQKGSADQFSLTVIKKMKKYLEDSIKELKVTLIYKAGPKARPLKFSAATILVDYEVALELGVNPSALGGGN